MRKRVNLSSSSSTSSSPSSHSTIETNDEYEFQKKARKNRFGVSTEDFTFISSRHVPENILMPNLVGHVLSTPDTSHAEFQFEYYGPLRNMNLTSMQIRGRMPLITDMHPL
jgi:hypothetical protein